MNDITLIANSGIQIFTFRLKIDSSSCESIYFEDWTEDDGVTHHLELLTKVETEDDSFFFKTKNLANKGFLAASAGPLDYQEIVDKGGIAPVISETNDDFRRHVSIVSINGKNELSNLENKWLPIPYFYKRKRFLWGPLNWSRFKLIPVNIPKETQVNKDRVYDVLLAFDTRTKIEDDQYKECPVFNNKANNELNFEVCNNELLLMDYCSSDKENNYDYINNYIFELVNPGISSINDLRGKTHKMSYITSYFMLIDHIAKCYLFPKVTLFKDWDVVTKDVDLIVDIGNSRTTAILSEDKCSFETVRPLSLQDFTDPITDSNKPELRKYDDPFDMRLTFRKVQFGNFGIHGSKQFVFPSLVRLGHEANNLMHRASDEILGNDTLSTYSSPKRYLWDNRCSKQEWKFLVLKGEDKSHILEVPGITNQLNRDGSIDTAGCGGSSHRYSRRSLMTFAFLEMLTQATIQINSNEYRQFRGEINVPRRIKRVIVTCPTTMSRLERASLTRSAKDASHLLRNFDQGVEERKPIEIVPVYKRGNDEQIWYYDEATCSQLVYMYAEVAHKYKGNCAEFFNLYGKNDPKIGHPTITVGSLDIGAGTTDLMICKYDYTQGNSTVLQPDPLFFDSFYFAGDDMLRDLVQAFIVSAGDTSLRKVCSHLSNQEYHQTVKNFFGADYAGQSFDQKLVRRDFNFQISVPLMSHFLELLGNGSPDCIVRYQDVFANCEPNERILRQFKESFGIDFKSVEWEFNRKTVSSKVATSFDPLLKRIAAIMYAYSCDVIILSGRPSSLPPIRQLFLKYCAVSPDRLISLNDYYVGEWYPGDNTGYIRNPKTIVAVGAMIGFYSSDMASFEDFCLDTSLLKAKLKSTINNISAPKSNDYCLTEIQNLGHLRISRIPTYLEMRQIDFPTYPTRPLFCIDYNYSTIESRIRKNNPDVSDGRMQQLIKDEIDRLSRLTPQTITIRREATDKESLSIDSDDSLSNNLQISIQSLGANDNYWLDTGIFEF